MLALLMLVADTTWRSIAIPVAPAETLHVVEAGAGNAVVLVPGLLGSAHAYRNVVPLLVSAGYRAIVIEPLGVGYSARPETAEYSLAGQADRLATALDVMGVRDAIVVAHSVASTIALRLAIRRPDLVGGIVSLEGGIAEAATTPGFRRAMKFAPLIRLFGGMGAIRGKIRRQFLEASADTTWVTDEVVRQYTAGAARDLGAALRAFRAMARSVEPDSLAPHLREVRCPVLLLLGAAPHDGGPPQAETALLADSIPWLVSDALPGVGHFPHEEAPELVAAAVDRMRITVTVLGPLFRH
jgi:pimeloyl-ACP methyl ester carboxylesterase